MRTFACSIVVLTSVSCARTASNTESTTATPASAPTPGPRRASTIVYDPTLRRVLLTGGYVFSDSGDFPNGEIWSWDGRRWERVARDGPPARWLGAAAFDSRTNTLVIYGGARPRLSPNEPVVYRGARPSSLRRDTWRWDGTRWYESRDTSPGYRDHHAMAFDVARGKTVLFGGIGAVRDSVTREWPTDVWEWDGSSWSRIAAVGPLGRGHAAMVYDARRGEVVVFGGLGDRPATGQAPPFFSDTWLWNGRQWRNVDGPAPPGRYAHAMAYDARRGVVLLYGGSGPDQNYVDFWSWDGARWSQIAMPGPNPGVRYSAAMTYDAARDRVVLVGGVTVDGQGRMTRILGDVWEWDGSRWHEASASPA
jgi:hypothetical protein